MIFQRVWEVWASIDMGVKHHSAAQHLQEVQTKVFAGQTQIYKGDILQKNVIVILCEKTHGLLRKPDDVCRICWNQNLGDHQCGCENGTPKTWWFVSMMVWQTSSKTWNLETPFEMANVIKPNAKTTPIFGGICFVVHGIFSLPSGFDLQRIGPLLLMVEAFPFIFPIELP